MSVPLAASAPLTYFQAVILGLLQGVTELFPISSDWIQIIRAFVRTLSTRRIATLTERLAWLIITASIPTGILGLAFEHQLRTLTAKPLLASILLIVNGVILLGAERARRQATVRELAIREGAKRDGGRELRTLDFREAALIGVAQSASLAAGISRDGIVMGAGLARAWGA